MSVATLSLERLRPGLYGWRVSSSPRGPATRHGSHTSLAHCLEQAMADLSDRSGLVEILYCDMPMGTMESTEVRRASREIAQQIKSLHSALLETA